MAGVRRGANVVLRYLIALYVLGVVTQFFLVGLGIFGMKAGDTVGKAKSLDPHRGLGWILTEPGALLLLIVAALAWGGRARFGRYLLLVVLAFVQMALAAGGENHKLVGMFHPVNALLLLGLSGYLARTEWAAVRGRAPEAAPAAVPTA
ncbi:MAG TPA: DUF6220 domain-containing protein [Gaiellaceae bacterium]|nr:DUF6220 domain-containing protein [Gaiellaceae bacterium]